VDFDDLTTQIVDAEKRDADKVERLRALDERESLFDKKDPEQEDNTEERMGLFNRALVNGVSSLSNTEVRALSAGTDVEGGYIVAPEQFVNKLIKGVDDMVYIRQKSNGYPGSYGHRAWCAGHLKQTRTMPTGQPNSGQVAKIPLCLSANGL